MLPDNSIFSMWNYVLDDITGSQICLIEDGYKEALIDNGITGTVTFGEVTDALEQYLKENQND